MQIGENELYRSNVFYYLSETYEINNSIILTASSNYHDMSESGRSTIDAILDNSEKRWVSGEEEGASFTIKFKLGSFYIQSYVMKWSAQMRYNENWKVEGFDGSSWFVIDERVEKNMCERTNNSVCITNIEKLFVVQKPEAVTTLRFSATDRDSLSENIFSLTQILLFGQYSIKYSNPVVLKSVYPFVFFLNLIFRFKLF